MSALSSNSLNLITIALANKKAAVEFASAVQFGAKLSASTMAALVVALGDKSVANNLQAAMLGTKALSARDVQFLYSGFANTSTVADIIAHLAGGTAPGATKVLPLPAPIVPVTPQVALPSFSPLAGAYLSTQLVSIASATVGAALRYTIDGSTPTGASPLYSSPISVAANETIKAIGIKAGFSNSAIATGVYIISAPGAVITPTFSPPAGPYGLAQMVTVSSLTSGATFYYTTNGSTPTILSTLYSGPISIASSQTLKVLGVKLGLANSAIATSAYVIGMAQVATPTFSPIAGAYGSAQMVTVSSLTAGATFYYTTNGSTPTILSTLYSGPISVASSQTLKVLGVKSGFSNSAIGSAAYVISASQVATPTFLPVAGSYAGTQMVAVSSTTPGATFYYTTNGSTPTILSTLYSGPISVSVSETLKVLGVKSGFTNSAIAVAVYTITALGPAPVNLLSAGNYRILTEAGISTTAGSAITGDIAVSPIASTAITGFALVLDGGGTFSTSALVTGQVKAANYAAPTPGLLTTAISDKNAAYTDAAGRTLPDFTNLGSGNLSGLTLVPGLYKWTTGVTIPGNVTLNGGPSDVWIMQISGTLNLSASTQVILTGGALPQNVFWQVTGAVTLGVSSTFRGIVLGATNIAVQTTATVHGRLYAGTAVTLDNDAISV